ncbi:PR domain zinc finger protein 5 [Nymphon striatum]|nr:PR domain zinc finger protein 5 [Nymphon striatum]
MNSSTPSLVMYVHWNFTQIQKDGTTKKACPYCMKLFHPLSVRRHVYSVHFPNRVVCPHCNKTFCRNDVLKQHILDVHKIQCRMQMKKACPYCNKLFHPVNVKRHVYSVHIGKRVACPVCNKSFSRRDSVKQHITEIHPEFHCHDRRLGILSSKTVDGSWPMGVVV